MSHSPSPSSPSPVAKTTERINRISSLIYIDEVEEIEKYGSYYSAFGKIIIFVVNNPALRSIAENYINMNGFFGGVILEQIPSPESRSLTLETTKDILYQIENFIHHGTTTPPPPSTTTEVESESSTIVTTTSTSTYLPTLEELESKSSSSSSLSLSSSSSSRKFKDVWYLILHESGYIIQTESSSLSLPSATMTIDPSLLRADLYLIWKETPLGISTHPWIFRIEDHYRWTFNYSPENNSRVSLERKNNREDEREGGKTSIVTGFIGTHTAKYHRTKVEYLYNNLRILTTISKIITQDNISMSFMTSTPPDRGYILEQSLFYEALLNFEIGNNGKTLYLLSMINKESKNIFVAYNSLLLLGDIYSRLDTNISLEQYMKAMTICPLRLEAPYRLISYYLEKKIWPLAISLASHYIDKFEYKTIISQNISSKISILKIPNYHWMEHIDLDIYTWKFIDLSSRCYYYSGDISKFKDLATWLIDKVPEDQVERIKNNLSFV